jgi:UDP-N-acetylmuramate--alanine ligase
MNRVKPDVYQSYFFIGIAGSGMSAIAQYLKGIGKTVSGSDRQFNHDQKTEIELQLNSEGIMTYKQDGTGLHQEVEVCVISTAIEQSNPEIQRALELGIPILHRADLLAAICDSKRTVAVSGTSGKSTTSAMIYHIMEKSGKPVSFIGGAGLVSLQEKGKIGNAIAANSDWLVIEADESDGSLVKYHPEIGIILNIDKDHKEIEELETIFETFKENVRIHLIVNQSNTRTKKFSQNQSLDFGTETKCGYKAESFSQQGFSIQFKINQVDFDIPTIGQHNMENAAAAVAACSLMDVSVHRASESLKSYKGIYRRHQLVGIANGLTIIDDYAHNPAKLAASIKASRLTGSKLLVWFQPHGFAPTKFLRDDFVQEIASALRENDEIWMSEIYYAGGTVSNDISAKDLIEDIEKVHPLAFFVENRDEFPAKIKSRYRKGDILLLTGARDPSLADFAKYVFDYFNN